MLAKNCKTANCVSFCLMEYNIKVQRSSLVYDVGLCRGNVVLRIQLVV